MKWAAPTAEALRQACLAQESRIAQELPSTPSVYISSIHVDTSRFLGPINLFLNSQYNAIIGGRGTGKSTILDYLRWALGDNRSATREGDEIAGSVRQQRLIEATLREVGGQVEVNFMINGISHVVRRDSVSGAMRMKVGTQEFEPVTESDLQALLPIHAYSQKQLSSVSVRTDELTRFVTAPIRADLDAKDAQIKNVADLLRQNYAALQRARSLAAQVARDELAAQSLVDQASAIRGGLTGLSESDHAVLKQRDQIELSSQRVKMWNDSVQEAADRAEALVSTLGRIGDDLAPSPNVDVPDLDDDISTRRRGIEEALNKVADSVIQGLADLRLVNTPTTEAGVAGSRLVGKFEALDRAYEDVKQRAVVHSHHLSDLEVVERKARVLLGSVESSRSELSHLGDPQETRRSLRSELVSLGAERSEILADQCNVVTELSGGLLRAELIAAADSTTFKGPSAV